MINTRSLILRGRRRLLHADRRPLAHGAADGPWSLTAAAAPPRASATRIAKDENQSQVDLMEEPATRSTALLAKGKIPEIIVSTVPGRAHRRPRASPR